MFLVYEKNYLSYGDVDCVEETDMKLFNNKKSALEEMENRKNMFINDKDNDFTFMENESSDTCFVFADELNPHGDDRSGEFHICLVELEVNDKQINRNPEVFGYKANEITETIVIQEDMKVGDSVLFINNEGTEFLDIHLYRIKTITDGVAALEREKSHINTDSKQHLLSVLTQ